MVFTVALAVGNILIVPGLFVVMFTPVFLNPIRWLEEGKSAFQAPAAPWTAFILPWLLAMLWIFFINANSILIPVYKEIHPYLGLASGIIIELLWSLLFVLYCQLWRLGISLEPPAAETA